MVVIGNYIWMYGGLSFSKGPVDTLARYFHYADFFQLKVAYYSFSETQLRALRNSL